MISRTVDKSLKDVLCNIIQIKMKKMLKLQSNMGIHLLCFETMFRKWNTSCLWHVTLRFNIISAYHHSSHHHFHHISKHQWFQIFNLQGPDQNFKISFQVGSVEDQNNCSRMMILINLIEPVKASIFKKGTSNRDELTTLDEVESFKCQKLVRLVKLKFNIT